MEPFIAQIIMFGGNFAPRGWAFCEGQLLSISQYTALFSLLGTVYGGDGRTTFALPDLRGRAPIHQGSGPGLPDYRLGQKGGSVQATLPTHTHTATATVVQAEYSAQLKAYSEAGNTIDPTGARLANTVGFDGEYLTAGTSVDMASDAVAITQTKAAAVTVTNTPAGTSATSANMQPYLAINYIIALQGIFPSRS